MSRADACAFPSVMGDPGLTIREHFAGLAMQSVIASCSDGLLKTGEYGAAIDALFAQKAISLADALIAELAKPVQP